jgi:hypothetical protein
MAEYGKHASRKAISLEHLRATSSLPQKINSAVAGVSKVQILASSFLKKGIILKRPFC